MSRKIIPFALVAVACTGATVSTTSTPAAPRPVAGAAWPEEGPMKWAPRPTGTEITPNDLRTRLYGISDDSMEGRAAGSVGNFKTTAYIAAEFRRLGLKPAGDNGTYFQDLPWGPTDVDLATARLTAGGAALTAGTDWVPTAPAAANRLRATVDFPSSPTVFAGRWGDTATALDVTAIRGKVAVFLAPRTAAPAANARGGAGGAGGGGGGGGRGRGGAGPTNYAGVADLRAANAGAVAILVASLDSIPANARRAIFNGGLGGMQPATTPADPANGVGGAAISAAAASRIFGRALEQLTVGAAGQPVSGSWRYAWKKSSTPARNVIAVLPGSDPTRATQYVLVGAHSDHEPNRATSVDHDSVRAFNWVMAPQGANDRPGAPTVDQQRKIDSILRHARSVRPPRRDSIMNGADDDGSGTVIMLEIAEKFALQKPARSIIFISHQAEERGLLGSRWFVDHPTLPIDSVVAAFNMDMVGKGRVTEVKFGGPNSVQTLGSRRLSREFGDILDSVNAVIKDPMAFDRSWDTPANLLNRFCRSDQVNYVRKNIPVTYFSLGYTRDYHMVTDEPQYIDYEHMRRLGTFIHEAMWAIAVRKDKPAIAGPDPAYPRC
jgi:hypothetical protein